MKSILTFLILVITIHLNAQEILVPKIHSNIEFRDGKLQFYDKTEDNWVEEKTKKPKFSYSRYLNNPEGTENGVKFDFLDTTFNGSLYYGIIKFDQVEFPQPVYFKSNSKIEKGVAEIDILKKLSGKYDFVNWAETGKLVLGYRIIKDNGLIVYDGRVNLKGTGPFEVDLTVLEGPFINLQEDRAVTISFKTNKIEKCSIIVEKQTFFDEKATKNHEIKINNLEPFSEYDYTIQYGDWEETYSFKTARQKGSRRVFKWAYASDCRGGAGGGERAIYGVNHYVVKKMMTLAKAKDAAFFQFTGDVINGYNISEDEQNLEYVNFKHATEYFGRFAPVNVAMGNHEALMRGFKKGWTAVDRFPYDKYSAEKVFADNFVNPTNGPLSEDGANYDPDSTNIDFPNYKENAFYYTYGNMAMIVLNSNYWYAPSTKTIPEHSGNVHGYLMDNQIEWFRGVMSKFENDKDIDHVFVTLHTPAFPNGGHSKDDMWYSGDNEIRAYVSGNPVEKGIIERRDEFLDIMINQSQKCVMMLNGDEHNYNRMTIDSTMEMYPKGWDKPKLEISRPFIQITNGAAGAPYYAQEVLPWSDHVDKFSALNALMIFTIEGKKVFLEVVNPDTFELIEKICIR